MKRQRRIASGQGWLALPEGLGRRLLAGLLSDQPENTITLEGEVKVRKLEPFPPKPEVERTNLSGELEIKPVGAVRRRR